MERKSLTVKNWDDHELSARVAHDCMLLIAPGVFYHYRLDMYFIVTSLMSSASAAAHLA